MAAIRKNRIKLTVGDRVFNAVNLILMILILAIIIYPLWFVVIASFSDSASVLAGEVWLWPKGFHLDSYRRVFANSQIRTGYLNTIIYTVLGTFVNLVGTVALGLLLPFAGTTLGAGAVFFLHGEVGCKVQKMLPKQPQTS